MIRANRDVLIGVVHPDALVRTCEIQKSKENNKTKEKEYGALIHDIGRIKSCFVGYFSNSKSLADVRDAIPKTRGKISNETLSAEFDAYLNLTDAYLHFSEGAFKLSAEALDKMPKNNKGTTEVNTQGNGHARDVSEIRKLGSVLIKVGICNLQGNLDGEDEELPAAWPWGRKSKGETYFIEKYGADLLRFYEADKLYSTPTRDNLQKIQRQYDEFSEKFNQYQSNYYKSLFTECDHDIYSLDYFDFAIKTDWDFIMGQVYYKWHAYDQSKEHFNLCKNKAIWLGDNIKAAECDFYIGKILSRNGEYGIARECLEHAKNVFERKGQSLLLSKCLFELSNLFSRCYVLDKARQYSQQAEEAIFDSSTKELRFPLIKPYLHHNKCGLHAASQNWSEYEKELLPGIESFKKANIDHGRSSLGLDYFDAYSELIRMKFFLDHKQKRPLSGLLEDWFVHIDSTDIVEFDRVFAQIRLASRLRDLALICHKEGLSCLATTFLISGKDVFKSENYGDDCVLRTRGKIHCILETIFHEKAHEFYKSDQEHGSFLYFTMIRLINICDRYYERTSGSSKAKAKSKFLSFVLLSSMPDGWLEMINKTNKKFLLWDLNGMVSFKNGVKRSPEDPGATLVNRLIERMNDWSTEETGQIEQFIKGTLSNWYFMDCKEIVSKLGITDERWPVKFATELMRSYKDNTIFYEALYEAIKRSQELKLLMEEEVKNDLAKGGMGIESGKNEKAPVRFAERDFYRPLAELDQIQFSGSLSKYSLSFFSNEKLNKIKDVIDVPDIEFASEMRLCKPEKESGSESNRVEIKMMSLLNETPDVDVFLRDFIKKYHEEHADRMPFLRLDDGCYILEGGEVCQSMSEKIVNSMIVQLHFREGVYSIATLNDQRFQKSLAFNTVVDTNKKVEKSFWCFFDGLIDWSLSNRGNDGVAEKIKAAVRAHYYEVIVRNKIQEMSKISRKQTCAADSALNSLGPVKK